MFSVSITFLHRYLYCYCHEPSMTCDMRDAVSTFTDHRPPVAEVVLTYPTLLADGSMLVISPENSQTD